MWWHIYAGIKVNPCWWKGDTDRILATNSFSVRFQFWAYETVVEWAPRMSSVWIFLFIIRDNISKIMTPRACCLVAMQSPEFIKTIIYTDVVPNLRKCQYKYSALINANALALRLMRIQVMMANPTQSSLEKHHVTEWVNVLHSNAFPLTVNLTFIWFWCPLYASRVAK